MAISDDFDNITTPKIATTYLSDEWDGLARALKACKDVGVALDAGTFTLSAAGNGAFSGTLGVTGTTTLGVLNATGAVDFASTLQVDADLTVGDGGASSGARALVVDSQLNQVAELVLKTAGTEFWALQMGTAQEFNLKYLNGDNVVVIEPAADANSIYIDADGHVGIGTNPTASFGFAVTRGNIWYFHNQADASASLRIGAGSTSDAIFDLIWVDRSNAIQWRIRKEISNRMVFFDNNASSPVVIQQSGSVGSNSSALFIDEDGHIGHGADPTTHAFLKTGDGSTWKFRTTDDAGGFFQIQGGTAAGSEREVSYDFLDKDGTMQWRITKGAADPADLFFRPLGAASNDVTIFSTGGINVDNPTGGDKGLGTLNAHGVYDDNTLLTCYVADAAVDGDIDLEAWDARVDNLKATRHAETGKPHRSEKVRTHKPAAAFKARMARTLDLKSYCEDFRARKALAAFPTRDEWAAMGPQPLSSGEILNRLWEEAEVALVHRDQLLKRIEALEARPGRP